MTPEHRKQAEEEVEKKPGIIEISAVLARFDYEPAAQSRVAMAREIVELQAENNALKQTYATALIENENLCRRMNEMDETIGTLKQQRENVAKLLSDAIEEGSELKAEVERLEKVNQLIVSANPNMEQIIKLNWKIGELTARCEELKAEKVNGIAAFYEEHDILPLDSDERKAFPDDWSFISHEVWKRDPIVTTLTARCEELEKETYPDTEADGKVFCGKCGKLK